MRTLLIYSNQSRELVPAPPVGLSYVATATRAAGHEVKLLDLAFAKDMNAELAAAIDAFKPEVVGLSVRNIDNVIQQRFDSPLKALLEQVAVIRAHAKKPDGSPVPLVLGGPAISILAERALTVFGADYAIVGEGETAFPKLLEALSTGEAPSGVSGLCHAPGGQSARNRTQLLPCFAHSGMENWVAWSRYQRGGGTWPIQTKRGCPMGCVYCAYPLVEGKRSRAREPGEVVDEIERVLKEVKPRTFEFVDSTFNIPASHAIAICEEIIRRKVKSNFTAMGVNPRDVPPELFPLMKRAGFNSMMITAEAGNDAMLENLGKGFTMREVNACYESAKASGIKSMWFFMLGGPGETMETCEESIRYVEEKLTGRQFLTVFFSGIRILPDTALARIAVERNYIPAGTDFAQGVFYMSPQISEKAVLDRINEAIRRNSSIVHAAEGGTTRMQRRMYAALHAMGVAPPYWRFLPEMLGFPPLRYLRGKYPSVVAAG